MLVIRAHWSTIQHHGLYVVMVVTNYGVRLEPTKIRVISIHSPEKRIVHSENLYIVPLRRINRDVE